MGSRGDSSGPETWPDDLSAVILAAGKGERLRSPIAKVLQPINGRPIIDYVLSAVEGLHPSEVVVVIGHQAEEVRESLCGRNVKFALQEPQLGTAHALMAARHLLEGRFTHVLVCCGDTPLIRSATLKRLVKRHEERDAPITLLTAVVEDPGGYGRILRGEDGSVQAIIEEGDASSEVLRIREINSGFYVFRADFLWRVLDRVRSDNSQGEYYLTEMVALARRLSLGVETLKAEDPLEIKGVNTRAELREVEEILKKRGTDAPTT